MIENAKYINIPIAPEFLWFMLAIGIVFFITIGGDTYLSLEKIWT